MAGERRSLASARYPTIDVLRGLALISMISTHMDNFSRSTVTARVLHSARWIDGAFVFVALSGLVTGLVHRRVVERSGIHASASKLVRRAAFVYLVHVLLTLVSLEAYNTHTGTFVVDTPTWSNAGGMLPALAHVFELRLEPNFNTVLPMYVALLLWSVPMIALLRRGAWAAVCALSLAVYVVGQTISALRFASGGFGIADWQLLFTGALLLGWSWEHRRVTLDARLRRAVVCCAGIVAVAMYVAARLTPDAMERRFGDALSKSNGGWLAFVFAGAVLVAGYAVVERARRMPSVGRALRPLEILGTKGLPGYVAMVLTVLALDFVPELPRDDALLVVVAAICGATEYAAVHYQQVRRAPPAPASLVSLTPRGLEHDVPPTPAAAQPNATS